MQWISIVPHMKQIKRTNSFISSIESEKKPRRYICEKKSTEIHNFFPYYFTESLKLFKIDI